jgi:hypothetical protein
MTNPLAGKAAIWTALSAVAFLFLPGPLRAGPAPEAAMGRLEGRVTRGDGTGAPALPVILCGLTPLPKPPRSDAPHWTGCATTNRSTTGADGSYSFDAVAPGTYILLVQSGSNLTFLRHSKTQRESVARIEKQVVRIVPYTVTNAQTTRVEDMAVLLEVKLLKPTRGEVVQAGRPNLQWEAVTGVARYQVSVATCQSLSDRWLLTEKTVLTTSTQAPQLPVSTSLTNCDYVWWVEGFDAKGTKLAESWNYPNQAGPSDGIGHFVVTDQPKSCRPGYGRPRP